MWVWPNSYFRLIYIHALYQKTLLFVVNRQFRSAANDRKSIRLLHKMKEQEHWYAFSNISYNFLPQLIYRAIDTGLDIATEREQLHRHLEQEAERLEKNSERRLAGLILFLTMLTVCSATYDGADAETVNNAVATPVAQAVMGVSDMLYMQSTSANDGSMVLQVVFDVGTDPDLDAIFTQNNVATSTALLPSSVVTQGVVTQKTMTGFLMVFALHSDGRYDNEFLSNYAYINLCLLYTSDAADD